MKLRPWSNRTAVLRRKEALEIALFLSEAQKSGFVRTHQEGGHLPARKRILTRNWISQCPDLELFRHQNCENQFLLCKPLSLWYLLWQFKWRKCLSTPSNHLSFIALYHHLDFVYIFVICVLFGSPHQNTCSMEKNFVCYKCCCTKKLLRNTCQKFWVKQ